MTNSLLQDIFRAKVAKLGLDMRDEAKPDILYPTGFLNFDYMNGYVAKERVSANADMSEFYNLGITDGSYVCLVANSGTGKSTFAEQIAANIVRRFPTSTIFVDMTETTGMTETRRLNLSKFTPEEYKVRYNIRNKGINAENIYKRIKMIHDVKVKERPNDFLYDTGRKDMYGEPILKFEPTVYIIDSIAALMPENMAEEEELAGKSYGAQSAAVIAQLFTAMLQPIKEANIIVIGINHFAQDINMSIFPKKPDVPWLKQGERIPKGKKVTLLANNIIRLDNVSKLKMDEGYKIEGSIVDVSLVKSRTSGNKRGTRLVYDFANGFDPWLSLLEFMKYNKHIYGAGVSLSFDPDRNYKFSMGNFKQKINTDPEFRKAFLNFTIPYLKQIPIEVDESAENMHMEDILNDSSLYIVS